MDIVLATSNTSKIERLEWLLQGLSGVNIRRVEPLPIDEGADSVADNALLKARTYAATYAMCSVATDGGLLVPALGSRWNPALTGRRSAELLELLRGMHGADRAATQLECVAVVGADGRTLGQFEALSGTRSVAEQADPRGITDGFWLPRVLRYGPAQTAFADLTPDERTLADDHWLALRRPLCALIQAELTRADARSRQPGC